MGGYPTTDILAHRRLFFSPTAVNQLTIQFTYQYLLDSQASGLLSPGTGTSFCWRLLHNHSQPRVGDLPRTRSVNQEQLAEGSDSESAATTGRPAAWPARSPDAPPDPATRQGGRETMPDEQAADAAARTTIRHGSGKSAEAILAG